MKGRTLWIAWVLACLLLFVPGTVVLAEDGPPAASFWMELCDWLAALIQGPPMPDALGGAPPTTPPNEPEAGILIPPGG